MIPDWKLERYLLRELSEEEMAQIESAAEKDDILQMRIRTLKESNAEFLKNHPAEDALSAISTAENSGESERASSALLKIAATITVLLGVIAVAYLKFQPTEMVNGMDETGSIAGTEVAAVRIKGLTSRFEVWKKSGDSAIQMQDKDSVIAGDELQIRYAVAEKCFGLLFSMDGNGVVTIHIGQGNDAVELTPQNIKFLPTAYKLDNAPHFEKFYFLTASEGFSLTPENIDILLKQQNIKQTSLTLIKDEGK